MKPEGETTADALRLARVTEVDLPAVVDTVAAGLEARVMVESTAGKAFTAAVR